MTLDQLVAFVAVADAGAFTAASARLHKSQPALSKLVRNLELELGVTLFDRSAYRARLTDRGRHFYERAAALLESSEALRGFGAELAGDVEPIVRLAIEAVTPLAPLMPVLRDLRAEYPGVRLELATERLSGAIDALREDRADVAIATKLGTAGVKLDVRPYQRVRVIPVAHAAHALAKQRGAISREQLQSHAQIVLRDSATGPDSPSLNVLDGGLRWSVDDVAAKREVILAGMGWGGLPEHAISDLLAARKLVALRVPGFDSDAMELFVLRRRDRAHGPVSRALFDRLARAKSVRE
jgi:DNA-binding transcriptional LysR family regulator